MMITGLIVFSVAAIDTWAGSLTASDLSGRWELLEIESQPVQAASKDALPIFTIKDKSIEGFDGCNRFWGRLDQPGSIASTRRGCMGTNLKLPLDLSDPLSHLGAGKIDNERLVLPKRAGIPASVFKRAVRHLKSGKSISNRIRGLAFPTDSRLT
jgi:heat shock protein HslJ